MKRHIIDTPPLRTGERLRAYMKIARRELSFPERTALFRAAGKPPSSTQMKQFLRIERERTS